MLRVIRQTDMSGKYLTAHSGIILIAVDIRALV